MLRILSEKKRRKFYEDNVGQEGHVLFEKDIQDGMMHGFTENYIRISTAYDLLMINEIRPVKMKGINSKGLMEVEELDQP